MLLQACSEQPAPEPVSAAPTGPVVVYASHPDDNYLPALFAGFTDATGIRVVVKNDNASVTVDTVIANRGKPVADVLLTSNVYDAWRAADRGALRPLGIAAVVDLRPDYLRDPDGMWVAVSERRAAIAFDRAEFNEADFDGYASLASENFRGKLCLTGSQHALNRNLIAVLINQLGQRPAEIVVRAWLANLAAPPFADEQAMLAALQAGTCAVAIAGLPGAGGQNHDDEIGYLFAQPAIVDVEAVGIGRHAEHPDAARQLIGWLLRDAEYPGSPAAEWPAAAPLNVGIAGWHADEAIRLAERAGW
jgi:iron(III) transport system substrate-binding protein